MKEAFAAAEKLVQKMEAAKKVRFAGVERKGTASSLKWTDLKTNETKVYAVSP